MPDQYLYKILAPCGLSVEHLKVKGFQNVMLGTRQVSMVIHERIAAIIKISNIQLSFRYRRQPPFCFVCQQVEHAGRDCPQSRRANKNILNADLSTEDLHHKIHNVKEGDLGVKLNNYKKVSQVPQEGPSHISSKQMADPTQTPGVTNKSNSNDKDMPKPHSNDNDKPNSNEND